MRGGGKILLVGLVAFLAVTLGLIVLDAGSGDWPGWDEGWALVAFPVGIPLAVSLAVGSQRAARDTTAARGPVDWRLVGLTTLAVWVWGAALFVVWMFLGA